MSSQFPGGPGRGPPLNISIPNSRPNSQPLSPQEANNGSSRGTPSITTPTQTTTLSSPMDPGRGTLISANSPSSQQSSQAPSPRSPTTPSSPRITSLKTAMQSMAVVATSDGGLNSIELMKRPGFGSLGTKIKARCNYFMIDISGMKDIFQYCFQVCSNDQPRKETKGRERREVIKSLLDLPGFASAASNYSDKIFSTMSILPSSTTSHKFAISSSTARKYAGQSRHQQDERYSITVYFEKILPIEPMKRYLGTHSFALRTDIDEYITAFNIFLSRAPNQDPGLETAAGGTKYFDIKDGKDRAQLGICLEAYRVYFKSARTSLSGLLLNVNASAGTFYIEGRLDELFRQWRPEYGTSNPQVLLSMLQRYFKIVEVEMGYDHGRIERIFGIPPGQQPINPTPILRSSDLNLIQAESIRLSTSQKLTQKHPMLSRPNRNALVVNVGSGEMLDLIPSDLCEIGPGQRFRRQLPFPEQTAKMIKFACRRPDDNQRLISNRGLPLLLVNKHGGPQDRFEMRVATNMMTVDARMLPSPIVCYLNGPPTESPASGSWNINKKKFIQQPARDMISYSWIEILPGHKRSAENLDSFLHFISEAVKMYCRTPNTKMVKVSEQAHTIPSTVTRTDLKKIFQSMLEHKVRLVFVILPNYSKQTYADIKSVADCQKGIHTICTVRKSDPDNTVRAAPIEIANLILKFNQKLGGINHTVQFHQSYKSILGGNTMIVGADVTHPGNGALKDAPSVAGVVASTDQTFFRYSGSFRLQRHEDSCKKSKEMIEKFDELIEERLDLYHRRNNHYPNKIVVYRDGVSEGQFKHVLSEEVPQLRRICEKKYNLERAPIPHLTVVVVQKRHHVRFYAADDSKSSYDQHSNPRPGLVIDKQVTSERAWDFYLTSHKCLQGTSRPAKYTILYDDIGVSADAIQLMTLHMCWLFGRATKSISVHPAARYADMLCDRARFYLHEVYNPIPDPSGEKPQPYKSDGTFWDGNIHSNLRDSMFFI